MIRLNKYDGWGFLIAVSTASAPLLALTGFGDTMSKDGPIGPVVYLLPGVVGLSAAVLASSAAIAIGRRREDRSGLYTAFGLLAGAVLFVSYCGWMNWWFEYARRMAG